MQYGNIFAVDYTAEECYVYIAKMIYYFSHQNIVLLLMILHDQCK